MTAAAMTEPSPSITNPRATITRRLEIDAGHRLLKHESKCRHVHGHRYAFEITVEGAELDDCGRVIDFGVVKQKLGSWLDDHWDHAFIAEQGDPIIDFLAESGMRCCVLSGPPSIENMTGVLYKVASRLFAEDGLRVTHLRGYETPNCWADVYPAPALDVPKAPPVPELG